MKVFLAVFLSIVVLFLAVGAIGYVAAKAKEPPTIEDAPWAIQTFSQDGKMTPSRVYFVAEVTIEHGQPIMHEYWAFDGAKFKKYNKDKTLPANARIIRRR